jgi:glycosyltransferase involved in cell wall biosynthesis
MLIFVVLPAYNSEKTIGPLLGRVLDFVPKSGIIVVDDGSTDDTFRVCLKAGIQPLRHIHNLGKGQALRTGFAEALRRGCAAVITLDSDGQHRPEHIPDFVKRFKISGRQIIIGSRKFRFSDLPFDRYLSNRLTTVVVSLLAGQRIEDSQSGYRLISASALRQVATDSDRYQMESEFLIRAGRMGFRIAHVPIVNGPSTFSHIRRGRDTLRFLAMALRMLWV